MARRLKNMKLTSVDLVRAGANQEADICLFKSLDGKPEDEIEEIEKFNPYHDRLGRFTTAGGGGASGGGGATHGVNSGSGANNSANEKFNATRSAAIANMEKELAYVRQQCKLKDTPKNRKTLKQFEEQMKLARAAKTPEDWIKAGGGEKGTGGLAMMMYNRKVNKSDLDRYDTIIEVFP